MLLLSTLDEDAKSSQGCQMAFKLSQANKLKAEATVCARNLATMPETDNELIKQRASRRSVVGLRPDASCDGLGTASHHFGLSCREKVSARGPIELRDACYCIPAESGPTSPLARPPYNKHLVGVE